MNPFLMDAVLINFKTYAKKSIKKNSINNTLQNIAIFVLKAEDS